MLAVGCELAAMAGTDELILILMPRYGASQVGTDRRQNLELSIACATDKHRLI